MSYIFKFLFNAAMAAIIGYSWHIHQEASAIGVLAFIVLDKADLILEKIK